MVPSISERTVPQLKGPKLIMDVSIVIRTKNEIEFIEETLKRVEKQDFSGDSEIIIVDSGSTDGTLDIVSQYKVKLIQIPQEHFTFGRSLNVGAGAAKGSFVVNLSAHALPRDEKWLTCLIRGFEGDGVAGVYGRQLSEGRLNPFEAMQNEAFFGEEKITFNIKNRRMWKNMHFTNSNSAVRRKIWETFKFNEDIPYAEDISWQIGVMEAGFSAVYTPDAAVYHTHKASIHEAYKRSKACAYALALMKKKRQSTVMSLYDMATFFVLGADSICRNLWYVWKTNHREYLRIAPLYVMSGWLGWLVGRTKYRLGK